MKITIFLLSGLFLSGIGFAQKGQHTLGLQAGTVMNAKYFLDGVKESKPVFTPITGIYYSWNFSRRLGLSSSALYRRKTMVYEGFYYIPEDENKNTFKKTLSFLEVPLNLTVNLDQKANSAWKTLFYPWLYLRQDTQYESNPYSLR